MMKIKTILSMVLFLGLPVLAEASSSSGDTQSEASAPAAETELHCSGAISNPTYTQVGSEESPRDKFLGNLNMTGNGMYQFNTFTGAGGVYVEVEPSTVDDSCPHDLVVRFNHESDPIEYSFRRVKSFVNEEGTEKICNYAMGHPNSSVTQETGEMICSFNLGDK